MKKKVLLLAGVCSAFLVLSGFDSAKTPDAILDDMVASIDNVSAIGGDADLDLLVSMTMGEGNAASTLNLAVDGGASMGIVMEPLQAKVAMDLNLNMFGMAQSMNMQMYGVQNDEGKFETYEKQEQSDAPGEWEYSVSDMQDANMDELITQIKEALASIKDMGLEFTVGSEPAECAGKECYVLHASLTTDDIIRMANEAAEASGTEVPEDLEAQAQALQGLKINIDVLVDTETSRLMQLVLDLGETNLNDIPLVEQQLGEQVGEMTLSLENSKLVVDMSYDFDTIEVPEEALAAKDAEPQTVTGTGETEETEYVYTEPEYVETTDTTIAFSDTNAEDESTPGEMNELVKAYIFNAGQEEYHQIGLKVLSDVAGEEANAFWEANKKDYYEDFDPEKEEVHVLTYEMYLPNDMVVSDYGIYDPECYLSVSAPDGDFLSTADDDWYWASTHTIYTGESYQPGDVVTAQIMVILPKDTTAYRAEFGPYGDHIAYVQVVTE